MGDSYRRPVAGWHFSCHRLHPIGDLQIVSIVRTKQVANLFFSASSSLRNDAKEVNFTKNKSCMNLFHQQTLAIKGSNGEFIQ